MAEIDNFSVINENFDTVKTLLNSIRAQGILNTSDVDKLLSGINDKLEKINTEKDIDIIKVYLNELKSSLDERHSVLVSKFGAIEALFSNLLKNSDNMPKSADLKEWVDVVATNLSVFSREVVSQKEALSDITLRIDSLRTDDSQKKEIIKNIAVLKPDLERLNNGFDSIVLSLNDNFKTIVKTISSMDKNEQFESLKEGLNNIENASNAVLSAIQMIDKKSENFDDKIKDIATKFDLEETDRSIAELKLINQGITESINDLSNRYSYMDNLSEKIDAAVSIIAGLKSGLEQADDKNTKTLLDSLDVLRNELNAVNTNEKFDEFKEALSKLLNDILGKSENVELLLQKSSNDTNNILTLLQTLDIAAKFKNVEDFIADKELSIKEHINENSQRTIELASSNVTRIINDISTSADALNTKLNQTQTEISSLCENQFSSVFENIAELKTVISQIDENAISANNAIFSNITDRLNVFELSLRESIERQELAVSHASTNLNEQVENIKNISGVIDYKMDSSVVEISNMKREFDTLKTAIESVLALNFVETVKDLRADLYASKQEMSVNFENSSNNLSEKVSNDLYGKYELIISKLDSVEDEFKKTQTSALGGIKEIMEKISASIVDVISYVSEARPVQTNNIDEQVDRVIDTIKENGLSYIENVRDVVDIIRAQVETSLRNIEDETSKRISVIESSVTDNASEIKEKLQNSYDKLLEVQLLNQDIKDTISVNSANNMGKFEQVLTATSNLGGEFDTKLESFKTMLLEKVSEVKQDLIGENTSKIEEVKASSEILSNKNFQDMAALIEGLRGQITDFSTSNASARSLALDDIYSNFNELKSTVTSYFNSAAETRNSALEKINSNFNELENTVVSYSNSAAETRSSALEKIYSLFENITNHLNANLAETVEKRNAALDQILSGLNCVKEHNSSISAEMLEKRAAALNTLLENFRELKDLTASYAKESEDNRNTNLSKILEEFDSVKSVLDSLATEISSSRASALEKLLENLSDLKVFVTSLNDKTSNELVQNLNTIVEQFDSIKKTLNKVDENVDGDMTRQLSIIESNFETLISQITIIFEKSENSLSNRINEEFSNISELLDARVSEKLESYKAKIEETFERFGDKAVSQTDYIREKVAEMNDSMKAVWATQAEENSKQLEEIENRLKSILDDNAMLTNIDYASLKDKLEEFTSNLETNNEILTQNFKSQLDDITKYLDSVLDIQLQEHNAKYDELGNLIKDTVAKLSDSSANLFEKVETNLSSSTTELINKTAEISANGAKTLEDAAAKLYDQMDIERQNIQNIRDFITSFVEEELKSVSSNIEKETDAILAELRDQTEVLQNSANNDVTSITSSLESALSEHIYNNIEDIKSYFDSKYESLVVSEKLDNLKLEITSTLSDVMDNLNKMLGADIFTSALSDFRAANEILVNSATDKINDKIEEFLSDNVANLAGTLSTSEKAIEEKLSLFDKKFADSLVDKYEELKLASNKQNETFEEINSSINVMSSEFQGVKTTIECKIDDLTDIIKSSADATSAEIRQLNECFENLRSQISNKSFDEAFQASIEKQIGSLEELINEQLGYIQDISDICVDNLPDVAEMNAVLKGSVVDMLKNMSDRIENQNIAGAIEAELKSVKSDIITQILNIFNQISFVTEQEEILDFIQDKHDELIAVLSHIVTTTNDITAVRKNVSAVDSKINSLRSEIASINDKITNIISSDGDVDYIYSLQDLEADIANLRIVLQEMKDNDHGQEFKDLVSSTEGIYNLVESIKGELPNKKDFDSIAEDIVSISSRTNKLILASDESYKTLQDNLQDFKLVINDLDERTRNFAQESGMDKIDSKLNAINTVVTNGAKTNQVFNQVFEYLAEWVDNASTQINAISDRVETLDDIGQIKVMLQDIKAEAEDNSENVELIEALGNVFDKQSKKISSIETKLDKMIVENTIKNNNANKIDMAPMEKILNKFLVAMDEKISSQQDKINSLETKLAEVMGLLDAKETAQLTKKVGGMDKQIAKLNKSIEKLASNVIEK